MLDLDKWQEIWLTINKHRLRTTLTCFGVFWGIFMLVLLLGAGRGLENGALQGFDIAKNAVFIWTQETAVPYAGFAAGRNIQLNNDDMRAVAELPEVATIAPRLPVNSAFGATSLTIERGRRSVSFNVMGDAPSFIEVKPYRIEGGRFLNPLDIDQKRKVAVIGLRVRGELFDEGEAVLGEYIRIGGVPFKVVGVFDTRVVGENAIQDLQTVHIPLSTAQQTFNLPNRVFWFGIIPAAGVSAIDSENAIKQLLRSRHKVSPDDRQALQSFNVEQEFRSMQGLFSGIAGFSWLVAIGTILAGMVGVANIMLIVVRERTKEIGIRKSLGARPASIVGMIVLEASVISGFAGYSGLVVGVALVEGLGFAMRKFDLHSNFFANPQIDFQVALTAIVVLLASGVLAGLFPGLKAAQVDPVIALRDE